MEYLIYYCIVILVSLFLASFCAGYKNIDLTIKSMYDCVIWPLTLCQILGTLFAHFKNK